MSGNTENAVPTSPPRPPANQPVERSRGEQLILAFFLVVTLLTSIAFTLLTVLWGFGFPALIVAILMGIFIGTLAYTFFGGVEGAVFQLGAVKLTGAAAVMVGVAFGINGPLGREMNDVKAIQAGRTAEVRLIEEQGKTVEERKGRRAAELRAAELEGQVGDTQTNSVTAIVARVRASNAQQPLGRAVLELYRDGLGPFNRSLGTVRLPVRFNQTVPAGTFRYCHERRSDFRARPVHFEIVNRETGTSNAITLEPGDDIGQGICSEIEFDVLLGCDAVQRLLPGMTAGCDGRSGVAWIPPNTNRNYDVVATILNPDLVPRSAVGGN